MCDSLVVEILIDEDMYDEEYRQCRFPSQPLKDPVNASADFRFHIVKSPITGAGFKITPLGKLMPGDDEGGRFKHGAIGGYLVEFNPPACMIGHNRQLVVSVNQGVQAAVWSLKCWLAVNGCTAQGLDRIKPKNVNILSMTLTLLYQRKSEKDARGVLRLFRDHTEGLLNTKEKVIAKSIPPEPPADGTPYTYTSYVDTRACQLSAYVKVLDQPNAFTLPLDDDELEQEMQQFTVRTLRLEVRTKPGWMKDNKLNKLSAWKGSNTDKSTHLVFGLLRKTLRLDENLRTTILRKDTVEGLALSVAQKKYLKYYLKGHCVREHADFKDMDRNKANKAYSAARLVVMEKTRIDFQIPNVIRTRQLSAELITLLIYLDEFIPKVRFAPYVFSRVSMPVALQQVKAIVYGLLKPVPDKVPKLPKYTVYRGPNPPQP